MAPVLRRVLRIFPNRDAVVRPVGAVLAEPHHEWAVVRRYLTVDGLLRPPILEPTPLPEPASTPRKKTAA